MRHDQLNYQPQRPPKTPRAALRLAMIIGPLLLSAPLPIWTVWYIGRWEATGVTGPIWTAIRMIPDDIQTVGLADFASRYCMGNLVTAGILLLLGFGIERFFVRRARQFVA